VSPMRILVADAASLFRAGVRNLLSRESDFEVIEAGDFGDLEQALEATSPDIALIDLELPPDGGVAAVAKVAKEQPAHLIVWSFEPTRETVLAAIRAGADGYLHKEISPRGLIRALRGAIGGEAPISRDLASLMIEALHLLDERMSARERAAVLSAREREVLSCVARGARNRQIASSLFISEFTVKRHMQNILQKLELPSRRAAAAFYASAFDERPEAAAIGEPA
jgi:two-component system, NarL family, nitrate/nitrite response regulator NarL